MINDQSTRLTAIAPIQGTADEYRKRESNCLERGMVHPLQCDGGEYDTLSSRPMLVTARD
jgi:hypothetical protein